MYKFESEYFALSDDAFHLMRSRFNFKSYPANEISQITIEKGHLINNWIAILLLGIALIGFTIYYSISLFLLLQNGEVNRIYIEEIVVPVIPLLLGIYCVVNSLRTGATLKIELNNSKSKRFPLNKLDDQSMNDLITKLKESNNYANRTTVRL